MLNLKSCQLDGSMQEYVKYYNHSRPHQGIGQQIPEFLAEDNPWPTRKPGGKGYIKLSVYPEFWLVDWRQ